MIKKPTIMISGSSTRASPYRVSEMEVFNATFQQSSQNCSNKTEINEAVSKVLEGYDWTTVQQTIRWGIRDFHKVLDAY